jgi:hypothetical protein
MSRRVRNDGQQQEIEMTFQRLRVEHIATLYIATRCVNPAGAEEPSFRRAELDACHTELMSRRPKLRVP